MKNVKPATVCETTMEFKSEVTKNGSEVCELHEAKEMIISALNAAAKELQEKYGIIITMLIMEGGE